MSRPCPPAGALVAGLLLLSTGDARAACPDCTDVWPPDSGEVALHTDRYRDAFGGPSLTLTESIAFADVDGDGKADLCGHDGTSIVCNVHEHAGGDYSCGRVGSATQRATLFNASWLSSPSYWRTIQYPDVDGDGIADVCGRGAAGIYCATGASGFTDGRLWVAQFTDAHGWSGADYYWKTIRFPDVDGDGRDDVCGRGSGGIHCAVSTGSSFIGMKLWTPSFRNADGWSSSPSHWGTVQFADVNDDGADDVCGRGHAGVYCALARPLYRDFGPANLWTTQFRDSAGWGTSEAYWSTIQLGDVNGDRMADVCGRGGAGVYCGISSGSSFLQAAHLDVTAFSSANGWTAREHYATIDLADVNGDGRADVCGRGDGGVVCALAKPFFTGALSGWTDLFEPGQLWVASFGDVDGFGASERYWGTVQAAAVFGAEPGAVFCGRGYAGVYCQNPWSMQVIPELECSMAHESNGYGDNKVAAILYTYSNDTTASISAAQARGILFTNANSTNAYFQAVSFGQLSLSGITRADGDVFGPFVIPAGTDKASTQAQLDALAGIDRYDYDAVVYWHPGPGRSNADGARPGGVEISQYGNSGVVIAHELMHIFGIDHANGYDCRDASGAQVGLSASCTPGGYNNGFSIQGSTGVFRHPTTYSKARLGWYRSEHIATIDADVPRPYEEVFTVAAMTEASDGVMALRVPLPRGRIQHVPSWSASSELQFYVYVEHRQPGPFEPASPINDGVLLVVAPELYVNHMTLMLDAHPTAGPGVDANYGDSPLLVGETFTDAASGVAIEVLSVDSSGARVRVRLD